MQYNLNLYLFVIFQIILISSCNREVIDFEDRITGFSTISESKDLIIEDILPKRIRVLFNPQDTSNVWDYVFHYDSKKQKLLNITLGETYVYRTFTYQENEIKMKENNTDPLWEVHLRNSKIDSITLSPTTTYFFPRHFYYDDSNNLVKIKSRYDSSFYSYSNGNMVRQVNYNSVWPYKNSVRNFEYYDSIIVPLNNRFYPLSEWDQLLPNISYDAIGYLNVFGNQNHNLLKMRVGNFFDLGTLNDTIYYKWEIKNSRIMQLDVVRNNQVWQKVYYEY